MSMVHLKLGPQPRHVKDIGEACKAVAAYGGTKEMQPTANIRAGQHVTLYRMPFVVPV
jgi:hypothetical protein